ncbi:MAG: hypothetical protein A3K19_01810 [Lentisphaerae bacterium RIFOXYB12_FULL_65_16]|nr:MAG: hypothetical protein A3K18_02455 [Lentisphaerae bacterium RIFOXYA12_64_32]OGV92721.1 MAG: hypothetical protein A3K19_01810 [Lentisphaerae bacterium RIFOXYB12_FULL_65_16]
MATSGKTHGLRIPVSQRYWLALATLAAVVAVLAAIVVGLRRDLRKAVAAAEARTALLADIKSLRDRTGQPGVAAPDLPACFLARLNHAEWRAADLAPGPKPNELRDLRKLVDTIRDDLNARDRNDDFLATKTESVIGGCWSELDGTAQPYAVALPDDYDAKRRWPLLVLLHGQGMFRPFQCDARPQPGMIVVAPHGRGGMDYKFVGELDVLRVVEEVSRLYPVDPDRVYLAGNSMGGTGAWQLATRFPDRFAAILPVCGNTDVRVWAERWDWITPPDSPQREVRDFLRDDTGTLVYAANLLNVGVVAVHGMEDPIVDALHSERMVAALEQLKHPAVALYLLPLVEHGVNVSIATALDGRRRIERPERVRYRTAWLKYDGADWVRIRGLGRRLRFADVDARVDPVTGAIDVRTANVTRLELLPDRMPLQTPPREVTIDGRPVEFAPGARLEFTNDEAGNWLQAEPAPGRSAPFPPPKSRDVEGPVEHALMSSFLVVEPSGQSPCTGAARAAAGVFAGIWRERFAGPPRVRRDTEVVAADIVDHNLILFGGPAENAFATQVIGALPVTIGPDSITLGGTTYAGPNAGVKLCYPNPLNPRRYVVLVAGTTPESYTDINVRFGNWFDWIPYDARSHFDYAVFDDRTVGRAPETFLVWGFFGEKWQFDDALRFEGVESWRHRVRPRVHPADAAKAADATGTGPLRLDSVAVAGQWLGKEYLERNRLFDGAPLVLTGNEYERGLAFRWPGSVTFKNPGRTRLRAAIGIAWDGRTEPCDDRKEFERAVFTVNGDNGKELYRSKSRRWNDPPLELDVDVTGHANVTLGGGGGRVWLNTTCVWANARLE